ncbi:MAG: glycosyltransferase family 2 protein [Proteobacteria bacterium]|nr:glycosyltransferase family 2 protein [Pseudomonadota bacterium]MBU1611734.1 glycosyltransferase family 2 protein [Pseudomonadota bacterium]
MMHGFNWAEIPQEVSRILLTGAEGSGHLLQVARAALEAGGPQCTSLGVDALCAAWESDPLNPILADQAAQLLTKTGGNQGVIQCCTQVSRTSGPSPAYLEKLLVRGDMERIKAFVTDEASRNKLNPAILSRLAPLLVKTDEIAWLLLLVERLPKAVGPARLAFLADVQCLAADLDAAVDTYARALSDLPSPALQIKLAGCLKRMGHRDRALAEYSAALAVRPWSINARLTLHDLLEGIDAERHFPPGPTGVLIYTYNKSDDLGRCLDKLAESDLGQSRLTVLDNGSTDDTQAVLQRFKDRFGRERMQCIFLPVNIGAPAARNWLTRPEALEGLKYMAFLDDDALVPPDWLQLLGAAVKRYPGAGVWGCKVKDVAAAAHIQNADLHLRPVDATAEAASHLRMTDLHLQTFDAGQFDYMRPCASVTGCCHLIDTRTFGEGHDFHIGFSPTQFDDLDRDLCRFQQGGSAVYTGHLSVGHLRHSGKAAATQTRSSGNALGNRIKLEARHPSTEVSKMVERQTRMLLEDILSKTTDG